MEDLFDTLIKWSNMVDTEINNQSDRAIALVCCSMLDYQLQFLLQGFFVESDRVDEDLFHSNMPLSTFSSKINISYYLGLISKDEKKNLSTLRKIRNTFAHQIEICNFNSSQSVIDQINNLFIPEKMYIPELFVITNNKAQIDIDPFKDDNTPKNRYVQTFKYLSTYLNFRIYDATEIKRCEYKADTAANLYRKLITTYKNSLDDLRETKKEFLELQKRTLEQKIEHSNGENEIINEEKHQLAIINRALENGSYRDPNLMAEKYGISEGQYYKNMYKILDEWDTKLE